MMIFSGGMPRASYGDRHAVSVMCDNRHVTFDLSSKVIDFLVVRRRDGCYGDAGWLCSTTCVRVSEFYDDG